MHPPRHESERRMKKKTSAPRNPRRVTLQKKARSARGGVLVGRVKSLDDPQGLGRIHIAVPGLAGRPERSGRAWQRSWPRTVVAAGSCRNWRTKCWSSADPPGRAQRKAGMTLVAQ